MLDFIIDNIIEGFYKIRRQGIYPVSLEWDKNLNKILDEGELVKIDDYTCYFKYDNLYYSIWIGNWPYSYGSLYGKELRSGYIERIKEREEDNTGKSHKKIEDYLFLINSCSSEGLPRASTAFKLRDYLDEHTRRNY